MMSNVSFVLSLWNSPHLSSALNKLGLQGSNLGPDSQKTLKNVLTRESKFSKQKAVVNIILEFQKPHGCLKS